MRPWRLFRAGISELLCRGRQEASKWLERVGAIGGRNGSPTPSSKRSHLDPAQLRSTHWSPWIRCSVDLVIHSWSALANEGSDR